MLEYLSVCNPSYKAPVEYYESYEEFLKFYWHAAHYLKALVIYYNQMNVFVFKVSLK